MPEIETLLRNKGIIPDGVRKWKSEEMVKIDSWWIYTRQRFTQFQEVE